MVPYIGFGCLDNAMMVVMGEAIDGSIGLLLGLSTLAAAALGNAVSNSSGMVLHGFIERSAKTLGLPDPRLTVHQRSLAVVKNVRMAAGVIGVLCGCLFGMFPLLFLDSPTSHETRALKKELSLIQSEPPRPQAQS